MNKEHQNIFINGGIPDLGLGFHNVGSGGVLRASNSDVVNYVDRHYGLRCGHIPDAHEVGVLVGEVTDPIKEHFVYLSSLSGSNIRPYTRRELTQLSNDRHVLVVPYINTHETNRELSAEGLCVWGIPPELVELKNKAVSTVDVYQKYQEGKTDLLVPEFQVLDVYGVVDGATLLFGDIVGMYERFDLPNYIPAVIMRAAESDGGYGNVEVRRLYNGDFILIPNGEPENFERHSRLNSALESAQKHLAGSMDLAKERRVVVSRVIDFVASPGNSILIVDGDFYSLGWNGQILNGDGKACVGTSRFDANTEALIAAQQNLEDFAAKEFVKYIVAASSDRNVDLPKVRGLLSVDLLVPGPLERKLLLKQGVNPEKAIYFVEVNPRVTNWTDAVLLMARIEGVERTVSGLRETINRGVLTEDRLKTPIDNVDAFRAELHELDQKLRSEGSHVVLRMPGERPGVIYSGDVQRAKSETYKLAERFRKVA